MTTAGASYSLRTGNFFRCPLLPSIQYILDTVNMDPGIFLVPLLSSKSSDDAT
jgi:hypothetical protein